MVEKRQHNQANASSVPRKRKQFLFPKSSNPLNDEGVSECFHKITTSLYLSLAPSHLSDPINGIKSQHLDHLIMSYYPKVQGVIIAYSNIKLAGEESFEDVSEESTPIVKVSATSPFTFMWVNVDFMVWKPQVGDVLEGYIYMQTPSHIGLLLHDTFNASIKKYNIPQTWRFVPNQEDEFAEDTKSSGTFKSYGYWVNENDLKVEGKLKFSVKSIHTTGRVVSVDGTLIEPGSEKDSQPIIRDRRSSTDAEVEAPSNKHKKFDDDVATITEIPEQKEEILESLPHYSKTSDTDDESTGSQDSSSS
ncbi:Piso0_005242 [Millerozyma farinosa CBS 7064]|uniref:DNA-directed RNA polymerase subunit n=1 Tax=Pichia sorbitophila (strain ATCC MYA-4447 / BCRC 22081 / CBS 7064 / NBRC 10061 / NRRL Y-12695) TaxID=559304 RepID=G8Y1N0_PICSO|nr:Piso0_005242 [Millerozyma farinosa CBS 7064]